MRNRCKTNKKVEVVMTTIFLFSLFTIVFNVNSLFAYDDFDEQLIIRGEFGDGPEDLMPRSIVVNLEDAITAAKNAQRIKITFNEELIGNVAVSVSIEKKSVTVYQAQADISTEKTLSIDISSFQSGEYTLNFKDSRNRAAYATFKIE